MEQNTFLAAMEDSDFKGLILTSDLRPKIAGFTESVTKVITLLNDKHMGRYRFGVAMEEAASTSDFQALLGTVLDQQLIAQYKMLNPDWRAYIATGTNPDFRPTQLLKAWGLEKPMPEVPQHGEYKAGKMVSGNLMTSLKKYGKSFGLTWEDIINDRLGAFTGIASMLARAAQKTEYRFATSLLAIAAGPNPALYGTALAHPVTGQVVNNKTALPLTSDNLALAISSMRNQVDADGEPISFENIHVVVPGALEIKLRQILNPGALISSGGDSAAGTKAQVQTSTNILTQFNITPHVNPYLPLIDKSASAAKTWYVFASPSDVVSAQVNYLRGHETPETFMKVSNQSSNGGGASSGMEGSFEDDTIWWKVRHCLGGTVVDPLGTIANVAP